MIFLQNLVCLVLGIMWRLLENQWLLAAFCNCCVWVPQLSWVPTLNLKIIKSLWGRNQMCRACWETNELTGPGGFLSRTVGSFEDPHTTITKDYKQKRRKNGIWTFKQNKQQKLSFFFIAEHNLWILDILLIVKFRNILPILQFTFMSLGIKSLFMLNCLNCIILNIVYLTFFIFTF